VIFLGDFSFVKIFLKNYCVTMTTTLNTSRPENTMVLSARVSACMYFLVSYNSTWFGATVAIKMWYAKERTIADI
jgi:hypothetical protein